MDIEEIRRECTKDPSYFKGNAYERTLIACDVLTRMGLPVPSWTTLREIIEKGSSGDINRGKAAFREQHAEKLKRLGATPAGIPEALTPFVKRLWDTAIEHANEALSDREEAASAQVRAAEESRDQAIEAATALASERDVARAEVEGLKTTLAQVSASLDSERAGRAAAQQEAADARAAADRQRQEMAGMLESAKSELRAAVGRLDGAEKHALREIDRARQDARREIDRLTAALNAAEASCLKHEQGKEKLADELARRTTQLHEVEKKLAAAEGALAERSSRRPAPGATKKVLGKRRAAR